MNNETKLVLCLLMAMLISLLLPAIIQHKTLAQFANREPTGNTNFLTYNNIIYKIKAKYPDNWSYQENQLGSVVVFRSPLESSSDTYYEHLIIFISNLGNTSLGETMKMRVNELMQNPNTEIVRSNPTTIIGEPAHELVFFTPNPSVANHELASRQILTIKDGKTYSFEYWAEPEKYSTYLPIIEEMINSFEFPKVQKCISIPKEVNQASDFVTYENHENRIRIQYPTDWEGREGDCSKGGFTFEAVFNSPLNDTRLTLTTVNMSDYFSLLSFPQFPEFFKNNTEFFLDFYIFNYYMKNPNYKIVDSNKTLLADNLAHKVVYTTTEGHYNIALLTIKNNTLYQLFSETELSRYSDNLPIIQKMIDSLNIR